MGGIIDCRCSTCDVDRQEFVGIGMAGSGSELCACYQCRRLVRKSIRWDGGEIDPVGLRCPYCQRLFRPVRDGDTCPICDGRLTIDEVGCWD